MFMQFLEICMGKVLLFCSLHNCFWWKLVYTWLDLQKRKQTELCKKLFKFAFQKSWIVLHVASGGKGMDCAILRLLEKVIFVPFLLNKTKLIISSSLTKLFYGTKTLRKYSLWPQMSSLICLICFFLQICSSEWRRSVRSAQSWFSAPKDTVFRDVDVNTKGVFEEVENAWWFLWLFSVLFCHLC